MAIHISDQIPEEAGIGLGCCASRFGRSRDAANAAEERAEI